MPNIITDFENITYTPIADKRIGPAGQVFHMKGPLSKGGCWRYQTEDFSIEFYSIRFSENSTFSYNGHFKNENDFISIYNITGDFVCNNPRTPVTNHTLLLVNAARIRHDKPETKRTISVKKDTLYQGICLRIIPDAKRTVTKKYNEVLRKMPPVIAYEETDLTQELNHLAQNIMKCKLTGSEAELFYDQCASDWFSTCINIYSNQNQKDKRASDFEAVEKVANYISDNYNQEITQTFLEEIALMSGTKLKATFKQRFGMSITEYTQRKRMDTAEEMLVTGNRPIKEIAELVGYHSPSRFSTLYKRYKDVSPSEVRSLQ